MIKTLTELQVKVLVAMVDHGGTWPESSTSGGRWNWDTVSKTRGLMMALQKKGCVDSVGGGMYETSEAGRQVVADIKSGEAVPVLDVIADGGVPTTLGELKAVAAALATAVGEEAAAKEVKVQAEVAHRAKLDEVARLRQIRDLGFAHLSCTHPNVALAELAGVTRQQVSKVIAGLRGTTVQTEPVKGRMRRPT